MAAVAAALLAGLFLILGASTAGETGKGTAVLLRALPAQTDLVQQEQAEVQADPTGFLVRAGEVILETDLLAAFMPGNLQSPAAAALRTPTRPQILALEFFPDAYIEVEVTSEDRADPQTLALYGRVPGVELATLTLTLTPESYFITFTDPHSTAMYRVVGANQSGEGRVIEYDLSKRPPVFEAAPLIPPVR
ncbi:hypothetical protein GWK36_00915 [Caldichromatium japonicum]|uniref:Uncharacterized protein n=1 Tax=Caldichromatium japonicum TaxID=2699430 RepID=A0A6G7V9P5_9GAMM|nr:hypothetical protein [Caldichromatium japonicum]QIK36793.1 hypothetical protein GWK36_00915 [Caldichromatium japonicum]